MDLKLTTARALQFEEETGKDLLLLLKEVHKTGEMKLSDMVRLFCALGEGYTPDKFDAWQAPFKDKLMAIFKAVQEYFGTDAKN